MIGKNKNELIKIIFIFIVSSVILTVMDELIYFLLNGTWVYRQTLIYGIVNPLFGLTTSILYLIRKRVKNIYLFLLLSSTFFVVFFFILNFLQQNVFQITINEYSFINLVSNLGLSIGLILWFEKITDRLFIDKKGILRIVTIIASLLYLVDVAITITAVNRFVDRKQNHQAGNILEVLYDKVYNDDFMTHQFPGLKK